MKKKNSVSEFTSERNAMLVANFRRQLAAQSQVALRRAFEDTAVQPAPRFWVSEQRAAVVISRMLREPSPEGAERILAEMFEEKREMYREIFRRVRLLRVCRPEATVCDLVFEVVNQPAPRSYMSWQRVRGVVYAEKRRMRLERVTR